MKHFFAVLLVTFSFVASAQYTKGGGGAFTIGAVFLPVDELRAFSPGQTPRLSAANTSIGGYGYWNIKNFVVGFKGSGFYGPVAEDNTYSYSRGGGMFTVDFGYKLMNEDQIAVYPTIGIGAGGFGYTISERRSIDLQSDNTPVLYQGSYNWDSVILDFSIRSEKIIGFQSGDCGKGGGMLGIELGYLWSPESDNWKTSAGSDIQNAPSYSMQGFYARLLIGGFGGE